MKKSIVLVQPFTHGRSTVRPLGLGYLASHLIKGGYRVSVIDNDIYRLSGKDLADRIISCSPDVAGITTNLLNKWNAIELAGILKDRVGYIVFGGPEASIRPEWFLREKNYFVSRGESEKGFAEFMKYAQGQTGLEGVKGFSFLNSQNEVINNPPAELEVNLDNIFFPDTELFEMDKYTNRFEGRLSTNIISSRGCPFKCIFCYHRLNGRFRQRSPQNVIDEMRLLKKRYGYTAFKFFDDNFTLKKTFIYEFCERLLEENMGIYWQCLSSARNVDEEMLRLMRRSGCRQISFGIESGSARSLKMMGKSSRVEDNARAIDLCRKIKIKSKAYITIGYPWEGHEDFMLTIDFIKKHTPDYAQAFIVYPFSNTDLERLVMQGGYHIDYEIIKGVRDLDVPSFETTNFTKEDLVNWRRRIVEAHTDALGKWGLRKIVHGLKRKFKKK